MSDEKIQKLELKVTELENQLRSLQGQHPAANVDPEDMKVFEKVSKQLGLSAGAAQAGSVISCIHCYHCIVCYRCINECICGPCNTCIIFQGGGGRFGSLG